MRLLQQVSRDRSKWRLFKRSGPADERLHAVAIVDAAGRPPAGPWWRSTISGLPSLLRRALLPEGYPRTVHAHYLPFTSWNFAHMVMSSALGVLSTQSLLFGLGLASGGHGMALSATLNWILKDGLGQLGGVAVVAYLGGRFDMEAKRYRFLGALLLKLSCLIELLVPLLPGCFVLTAAVANVLKNVSWMATSATRAQIHRHLARQDNLGDLTGRTASQNTLASLLGTGVGVSLSALLLSAPDLSTAQTVSRCLFLFAPLAMASLWASYKSCQYATSPRLTPQRMQMMWEPMLEELLLLPIGAVGRAGAADGAAVSVRLRDDVLAQLSRYILDPCTLARREPFLLPLTSSKHAPKLLIEPALATEGTHSILRAPEREFWISVAGDGKAICIWFSSAATDAALLNGMLAAQILRHCLARQITIAVEEAESLANAIVGPLRSALVHRGWDVDEISLGSRRHPITILNDADGGENHSLKDD